MRLVALVAVLALGASACSSATTTPDGSDEASAEAPGQRGTAVDDEGSDEGTDEGPGEAPDADLPEITLAFAGDVHFEGITATLPDRPRSTMGELSQVLRRADLAVVNLESPVTTRGALASKELEVAGNRFWFRSPPAALDVLERSGVDVASVANNHAGDYGEIGLRDTLRAAEERDVAVVGIGLTRDEAFTPYRETIEGTDVAVFGADSSFRESNDAIWSVAPGTGPGIASARMPNTRQLVAAVEEAAAVDDLVVVYLHWGDEGDACPTADQQVLARELAAAGADVVVGAHAHLPNGAGLIGDTYVSYGLGNFLWYNGSNEDTGVLELTVRGGEVVGDRWAPGTIPPAGGPADALAGGAARAAVEEWRGLRTCTMLEPGPSARPERPPYSSTIARIGPDLRRRMIGTSHDPATCPVPLTALRRLTMSYVDFNGEPQSGVMVVHRDVARDVVGVFSTLYETGFQIRQMRVIDAFGGDDNASMAANNSSGYNCRPVAGTDTFSDHAFGKAVDINPVQNPYVLGGGEVQPPDGRRFVDVDRSPGADTARGVIGSDDVVTRSFARIGWAWGGLFSQPDYQHFSTD
jgi:hypothetical protein